MVVLRLPTNNASSSNMLVGAAYRRYSIISVALNGARTAGN